MKGLNFHPYLYPCPLSLTLQLLSLKGQIYFLISWNWSWTHDLLWPIEWNGTDGCASTKLRPEEVLHVSAYFLLLPLLRQVHACAICGSQEKGERHVEQSQVSLNKPNLDWSDLKYKREPSRDQPNPANAGAKNVYWCMSVRCCTCFVMQQFHSNS